MLLVPCFHDEPLVRLSAFRDAYRAVGGTLFHSPEEQWFAEAELGLNHPNASVAGTLVSPAPRAGAAIESLGRRKIVYCGRYSVEKGVDRLLDFAEPPPPAAVMDRLLAWLWSGADDQHRLVVVNYAAEPAAATLLLPLPDLAGHTWRFTDRLGPDLAEVDGTTLAELGVPLQLEGWEYHLYALERV